MEVQLTSVAQTVDTVFEVRRSFAVQPWWRGHCKVDWKLTPSVFRRQDLEFRSEPSMLGLFMTAAPSRQGTLPDRSDFAWLFLTRHHGLPTRLLDWTQAALTALYFAVVPPDEAPGALWAVNPDHLNRLLAGRTGTFLPTASEIAPIFRRALSGDKPPGDQVAAVWPMEVDLRMLLQQSRFTVHDTGKPLEDLVADPSILRKHIIPAGAKLQIAAELESLGFRRSSLFPDLTTLAAEIGELRFKKE